jgi:pyruvate dehydrogenase E2 component (dihydrolipoamide acetyltransferase)
MATKLVMPQMGYDMQQGKLLRWLKKEGESVQRGDPIAEIETDKAVVEMEAYGSGVLRKILVPEGDTVPVGQTIGIIAEPGEALPDDLLKEATGPTPPRAPKAPPSVQAPRAEAAPAPAAEVKASPLARRLAEEKGIDLTRVKGTGPGGRIQEKDVLEYEKSPLAASAPPTAEGRPAPRYQPLTSMRQAIARLTARSKQEVPHFYITVDVEMTAATNLRAQVNKTLEPQGVRVSLNDLMVKACALALAKFPAFNSFFRGDKLQVNQAVNIGIAIALKEDQGLVVPAVLDCGSKSLAEISRAARDLVERANQGHLKEEEYGGGTFSISNLGMFDVDSFAAIIHPPQAAVLAVGAVRPQPVVREGQVTVAQVMKATLSVDHRVADGAQAARFLAEVKRLVENPQALAQ